MSDAQTYSDANCPALGTDIPDDWKEFDDQKPSAVWCGFLEVQDGSHRQNIVVRATRQGCFRFVFSVDGRVTAIQTVHTTAGQLYQGYAQAPTVVGVNCDCP